MIMKRARAEKNLTMRQVAEAAEISESFCSMIENGDRRPSVETAKKIAAVLGFSWTLFFEEEEKTAQGA